MAGGSGGFDRRLALFGSGAEAGAPQGHAGRIGSCQGSRAAPEPPVARAPGRRRSQAGRGWRVTGPGSLGARGCFNRVREAPGGGCAGPRAAARPHPAPLPVPRRQPRAPAGRRGAETSAGRGRSTGAGQGRARAGVWAAGRGGEAGPGGRPTKRRIGGETENRPVCASGACTTAAPRVGHQ